MSPKVLTRPVTADDLTSLCELQARVFGPGRFARTAYRVREGASDKPTAEAMVGRAAFLGSRMIASVALTGITVGGAHGAALLGPLVVDPEFANQGHGRRLVAEVLETAKTAGTKLVILVGDLPYYGRFGFAPVPPGQIKLPGPVDPQRLLAAELADGALASYRGAISAE